MIERDPAPEQSTPNVEAANGCSGQDQHDFESYRHLRPTSAFELFDRVFLVWRKEWKSFLLLGLLIVLPGALVELYALNAAAANESLNGTKILPWAFLAFIVQLMPLTYATRLSLSIVVFGEHIPASRQWFAPLAGVFPGVVVCVLFIVFAMAVVVNLGLAAVEAIPFGLLSIVILVVSILASLWVGANMCLAPLFVAYGWLQVLPALRYSWSLMTRSQFVKPWWRDNAYWRLALLMSFPLACHLWLAMVLRVAQWVDTGSVLSSFQVSWTWSVGQLVVQRGADVFLMPWIAIAFTALCVEMTCRVKALDLLVRLEGFSPGGLPLGKEA